MTTMEPQVVCIGSALKDIFLPTADGTVLETPEDTFAQRKIVFELGAKYRIEDRFSAAGGGACNIAMGCARLGVSSAPYALLGADGAGQWVRELLIRSGVRTDFLRCVSEAQTDVSVILVDRKTGERVIFVNRDLQETLRIDAVALPQRATLFVSALSGAWQENYAAIRTAVVQRECTLAFNPGQSNMDEDMNAVIGLLAHSTYVFVNTDEAMQIVSAITSATDTQLRDPQFVLSALAEAGPKTVVMTAGREGAYVYDRSTIWRVPSDGTRPVDSTGAGDAFSSGFLAARMQGMPVAQACAWGAANARNVIRYYGSNTGLLDEAEIRSHAEAISVQRLDA